MIYNIIVENLLPIFDPENDPEIIIEAVDNIIFQLTTSKNQLMELTDDSLNENNLSILDISNCEKKLKERYNNLNDNDNLIILKKEKKSSKASEKEIQFEFLIHMIKQN